MSMFMMILKLKLDHFELEHALTDCNGLSIGPSALALLGHVGSKNVEEE